MIQRVSELEAEPEVGRFYLVPCVPLYTMNVRAGWWPVLTPSHVDPDLGVSAEHYHYDWRFVSERHWQSVLRESRGDAARAYATVGAASWHGAPDERPMLCKRVPLPFPSRAPSGQPNRLVKILEPKYCGRRLGACMACPHKGLSLKNQPVRDGKVICPGHGLQFDVATGEMVPRLPSPHSTL